MKQIKINGSYICYKEFKITENDDLKNFLEDKHLKDFVSSFEENLIFVLGGDGTMLEAIKKHYKKNLPFFGINFGTKGFFLNPRELMVPGLSYITNEHSLIEIKDVHTEETQIAVNEFDIRSKSGRLATFSINISNKQFFSLEGDGVIISTPFGSTGYNSSLRGPILIENLEAFVITPKAPWKPKLFPSIVIKDDEVITVSNAGRKNPINIFSDGKKILKQKDIRNATLEIYKSKHKIKIAVVHECLKVWNNRIFE